jgi:hypothetical protein
MDGKGSTMNNEREETIKRLAEKMSRLNEKQFNIISLVIQMTIDEEKKDVTRT